MLFYTKIFLEKYIREQYAIISLLLVIYKTF
jgi:hypothetical protein